MPDVQIGTLSELRPTLRTALVAVSVEEQDAVITAVVPELSIAPPPNREAQHRAVNASLDEPDIYYAIHDADLDLLKEAATVGVAFCAGLPNAASLLSGLILFLYRYRRRRIRLTAEEAVILDTLRSVPGGMTVEELGIAVSETTGRKLTPDVDVTPVLRSLSHAHRSDGQMTALVAEQDDRWRTVDV